VGDIGRATLAVARSTVLDPATARVFLIAANSDDGNSATKDAYRSDDGGQSFIALGVNSAHRPTNPNSEQTDLDVMHEQAWYNLACAQDGWPAALSGFVIGGLQDDGTRLRNLTTTDGPSAFDQVLGGDGIGVAVSRDANLTTPRVVLASTPGAIGRSTAGGAPDSFFDFNGGLASLPFLVRLALDPAADDPQTFLTISDAPTSSVFRT